MCLNPVLFNRILHRDRINRARLPGTLSSVADPDPGSGAYLTPGSGMGKKSNPDPGRKTRIIFPRD